MVLVHHGLAEAMMTWCTGDGCASNSGGRDLTAGVYEAKEGWLVHHYGCRCTEGRWVWADSERER
jgi:hypothetical protein